ncbi:MAG: prepilin-type N-terminal cleavage/methylation domain-containing protein [Planctomycetes bacterium]|nr:prepilin-type N-terminal cleavage/methylation domain-containing protein [Planctomycetota bacterium]
MTQSSPKVRGITLIELLVVLAIVGVLLGLGAMSFLRISRKHKEEGVLGSVETALRVARNTALTTRAPAFVELDNASNPPRVAAWSYRLEGYWHFEKVGYESAGAYGLQALIHGCESAEGKVGKCLSLVAAGARGQPVTGYADLGEDTAWDLSDGGYLEAYVFGYYPFQGPQYVFAKKNCYSLVIDRGGILVGNVGSTQVRAPNFAIPPLRWTKVAFAWDKNSTRLLIDDAILAVGPGEQTPVEQESLTVGHESAPFLGRIDEVRILAADRGKPVLLYEGQIEHDAQPWNAVFFAADGSLDVRYHSGPVTVSVIQSGKRRPIFISMFGLTQRKPVEKLEVEEPETAKTKVAPPPVERRPLLPPKRSTGTIRMLDEDEDSDGAPLTPAAEAKKTAAKTVAAPAEAKLEPPAPKSEPELEAKSAIPEAPAKTGE